MDWKRLFVPLLMLPIILITMSGCDTFSTGDGLQPKDDTQNQPPLSTLPEDDNKTKPIISVPGGEPMPPGPNLALKLDHAPKLGETVGIMLEVSTADTSPGSDMGTFTAWLKFLYTDTSGSFQESKQTIEVPPSEVVQSENPLWEGTLTSGTVIQLAADVSFPGEGIWEITGWLSGEDLSRRSDRLRITVTGEGGTTGVQKDYSPGIAVARDAPITGTLDLTEPPKLGETSELTWSIVSNKDLTDAKVSIEFKLFEPGSTKYTRSASATLIDGNLQREGALSKDAVVASSATIKFEKAGDWEISIRYIDSEGSMINYQPVFLNVTRDRGRWGWAEPHKPDMSNVPLPPPVRLPEKPN